MRCRIVSTSPCSIFLPNSAVSFALSVQMWSPSESVCITWMGEPVSISAFSSPREAAFSRPTLACFLHVGQYISTFIESNDSSPRLRSVKGSYILFPVTVFPLHPLPLVRRPESFSHPDWLFEVKYDGFRTLAYRDPSGARLISLYGNRFPSFADLCAGTEFSLRAQHAVLDGEIVCLDDHRCSQFSQLLFRRGTARFCAFDLLYLDGKDLRNVPLIERKLALRRIVPRESACLMYVDYVEEQGERLFNLACERELEGIIAKHRHSRYTAENGNPAWVKIRKRRYSQLIGRDELFERRYEEKGAPEIGWDVCDRACLAAAS
jgi:ATP dependent DNA ligase domain